MPQKSMRFLWLMLCSLAGFLIDNSLMAQELEKSTPASITQWRAARAFHNNRAYDLAAIEWGEFVRRFPKDELAPKAQYYQGVCYQLSEEFKKAVEAYNKVRTNYPNGEKTEDAYRNLGTCTFRLGKDGDPKGYQQTLQYLAEYLKKFPEGQYRPNAYFLIGESYYELGAREEAIKAYNYVVNKFPKDELYDNALYALGIAQEESKQYADAAASYDQYLQEFPQTDLASEVKWRRAEMYYLDKEFSQAIPLFTAAAEAKNFSLNDFSLLRAADCYYQLEKYENAAEKFASFIQQYPDSKYVPQARLSLGKSYYLQADYDKTLSALSPVLSAGGKFAPESGHWMARCYLKQNQPTKALAAVQKALKLNQEIEVDDLVRLKLDEADAYYAIPNQRAEALPKYLEIFQSHPQHKLAAEALYLAALTAYETGKQDEALKHSQRFLTTFRGSEFEPDVRYISAESRLLNKQYAEATKEFDELQRKFPKSSFVARAELRKGLALYFQEKYQEAIQSLRQVTGADLPAETLAEAHYWTGRAYSDLENYTQAVAAFLKAQQASQDWRLADETYLMLGYAYNKSGQPERAVSAWNTLAKNYPKSSYQTEALYRLAEASYEANKYDRAIQLYQQAYNASKEGSFRVSALFGLAWAYLTQGKADTAAKTFTQVIQNYPQEDLAQRARYARGLAYRQLGEYEQGIADFQAYLTKNPNAEELADARFSLGLCHVGLNQSKEAIAAFEKLLKESPEFPQIDEVYYELAWAYRSLSQEEKAIEYFAAIPKRFPDSELAGEAYFHVAEDAYQKPDYPAAVKLYQQSIAKAERADIKEKASYKLGWAYFQQDEFAKAAERFATQVKSFPNGENVHDANFMLGECLYKQEKFVESHDAFRKALSGFQQPGAMVTPSFYELTLLRIAQTNAKREQPSWDLPLQLAETFHKEFPESDLAGEMLYEKAWALQKQKKYDEALAAYEKVPELTEGEAAAKAYFMQGQIHFLKRDHSTAVRQFYRAAYGYEYPKWGALSLVEAGRCFEVLKKIDSAKQSYNELIKRYGDNQAYQDQVRIARQRLQELGG